MGAPHSTSAVKAGILGIALALAGCPSAAVDPCNADTDCDSGLVEDMTERGIADPAEVKIYALRAAGEVAEAILRIDTIIKKREDREAQRDMQPRDNSKTF